MKDSLKYLLVPGVLFEEFGFKYYGPINGHDLPALMAVLENVKGINHPVLIHVETKKGKGYAPAEKNPDLFHGVSPFHIETGELKKKSTLPTYTGVFGKTLAQLGGVYIDIIIQADGHIVGCAIIEIGCLETVPSVLSAGLLASVYYPKVNGEFQDITEEYITEQIALIKAK